MIPIAHIRERSGAEVAFVVLLCRIYLQAATMSDAADFLKNNKVDKQLVGQMISTHQVRPLINRAFTKYPELFHDLVPERLQRDCMRVARDNMRNTTELVRISKMLEQKGITVLPYKGIVLSQQMFGDIVSRETCDIDFLVEPKDIPSIRDVLFEQGFKSDYYYDPKFHKHIVKYSSELVFYKETELGSTQIELHWKLAPFMLESGADNMQYLERHQKIVLLEKSIPCLSVEQHLFALLLHHGVNDVWRSLRHAVDVAIMTQQYRNGIDWHALKSRVKSNKILLNTETGFSAIEELLGVLVPDGFSTRKGKITDSVVNNLIQFPLLPKSMLMTENFKRQLMLKDSLKDKVTVVGKYLLTGLVPNTRDMKFIKLPPVLFPLYYIIKPFRLLKDRLIG